MNASWNHPALAFEEAQLSVQRHLGANIVGIPASVFASYEDDPDLRVTAAFPTDSSEHPVVVLKSNRFSFLRDSLRAHRLAGSAVPGLAPNILGYEETSSGSLLLLELFKGVPAADAGFDGLESTARSLAAIQQELSSSQAWSGHCTSLADLNQTFMGCRERILEHTAVWEEDPDGKLSQALCLATKDVPGILDRTQALLSDWIELVVEADLPLTLHHGDLHAGNAVIRDDGRALIYDWETGCFAHPFFSMEKLMTAGWSLDKDKRGGPWGYVRDTPSQDRVKSVYLREMGTVGERHSRAFDAAMCLATIFEMDHEMRWAEVCGWPQLNPEWTAQLLNRLLQHSSLQRRMG